MTSVTVQAQAPGQFKIFSHFKNIGLVLASVAGPGPLAGLAAPCMWLVLAGLGKGRAKFARALLVLAAIHGLSGCAENALTSHSAPSAAGTTPSGTYAITVTATSAAGGTSITQGSVITLTVK